MCASASLPEDQLLLLHVEEQAMVQVVIKEVAAHLDMKDSSKINTVCTPVALDPPLDTNLV